MSNKPLQSIKFPGLGDTYTIVDIENFASAYSTSSTYSVGEYVTYDGAFYVCTTDISTAEAWTPAHWSQVTVGEELSDYKAEINQLSESIAPVESTTTATAAQAVGELFLVGETLMVALSAIAIGDTIITDGASPNAAVTTLSGEMIKDVQVNGTSILSNGVANIPVMGPNVLGVAKRGTGLYINYLNALCVDSAMEVGLKNGTALNQMVVPGRQHIATFYGLAKAASDTTQRASSNPVGTYTETAKNKICNMIDTSRRMRLLKKITVTEASSSVGFELDENNNPFAVDEITIIACIPATPSSTRTLSYSIEETTTTSSSSRWVAQIANSTSTSSDLIAKTEIKRDSVGWKAVHNFAYGNYGGVYTGAVSVKGNGVAFTLNGASWVRTNNPLYATKFAIALSTDPIPAGAYFEIYAHDYQG